MDFKIEKVLERDMDLLIINRLISNKEFINVFLNKINKRGSKIVNIIHSLMDIEHGESDVTVIIEKGKDRYGLLIEDKITADARPEQGKRYHKRGDKGKKEGLYKDYFTFIVAPQSYLDSNGEVDKYDYNISYEELKKYLKNDLYATILIDKALEERSQRYNIIEDKEVTLFWKNLYDYIDANYKNKIKYNRVTGPRGTKAQWPEYKTNYKEVVIIQKSPSGCLDLTFSRMKKYQDIFYKYIKKYEYMDIEETTGSMAIRLPITPIDFHQPFNKYKKAVKESLDKTLKLYKILSDIDVKGMYKEIQSRKADINSVEDFKKIYKNGIIVNYDLGCTYRCSTESLEVFGSNVIYPNIQRYQTGKKLKTQLFMIRDNNLYKLKRVEEYNVDSPYIKEEVKETVSEDFYNDKEFSKEMIPPISIKKEELLEILEDKEA